MMIDYFTNGLKGAYTAYTEQIHGIRIRTSKLLWNLRTSSRTGLDAVGFPSMGNPRAAQRPPVHERPQCQPQNPQVQLQELQATIMFLLSLPARCICRDMRACMPVGVERAQCCYSNVLATERGLFAEQTLLSRFGSDEPRFAQRDADRSFLPERSLLEQGMQASNKAFSTIDWKKQRWDARV